MSMIERPANSGARGSAARCLCAAQWRSTVAVTYSMIENITGRSTSCGQRRVSKTTSGLSAGTVVGAVEQVGVGAVAAVLAEPRREVAQHRGDVDRAVRAGGASAIASSSSRSIDSRGGSFSSVAALA